MGYYAERKDGQPFHKAEGIAKEHGGTVTADVSEAKAQFDQGKGVLVVVNNGPFEAAGFVVDEDEWKRFHADPYDFRPRKYVILDRKVAERISGYSRE